MRIQEIERLRQKEISELVLKDAEEREKLLEQLNQTNTDKFINFYTTKVHQMFSDYDVKKHTAPLEESI